MKVKAQKRIRALLIGIVALIALFFTMIIAPIMAASASIASLIDPDKKYTTEYDSVDDILEAGRDTNLELAEESFTLLKNKNNTLPIANTSKVTVLGTASKALSTGGAGSGAQSRPGNSLGSDVASKVASSVYDGLKAASIEWNKDVEAVYEKNAKMPEAGKYATIVESGEDATFDGKKYKLDAEGTLKGKSLEGYKDAAIIVISRTGSEFNDNPTHDVAGHSNKADHYLMFNDAEKELFAYAKANFNKIIVLVNSPSVMELGAIEDDEKIGAILWIGQPGWNGAEAIGKVLTGEVNPSGHTVDFYMRDVTKDPTWYNFRDYSQALYQLDGEKFADKDLGVVNNAMILMNDENGVMKNNEHCIDYAEGIYMGYRYYETVYAELLAKKDKATADAWYKQAVVYPFGHGLSYTTFTQEITAVTGDITEANKDGKITVSVKVTNTGSVAGKDVVQLYSTPEYKAKGIQKAAVNLVGFEKTGIIAAGGNETVQIEIAVKDLASFDYNDANKNNHSGYELDPGKYVLSVRADSHNEFDNEEKTLAGTAVINYEEDDDEKTPNNIYSQTGNEWEQYNTLAHNWTTAGVDHYLTREGLLNADGTVADVSNLAWLLLDGGKENEFTEEAYNVLNARRDVGSDADDHDNPLTTDVEKDYKNPWLRTIPDNWTQGAGVIGEDGMYEITLKDMLGIPYDDTKWDDFMNQLTWDEIWTLASRGSFSSQAIPTVGKPQVSDPDGPGQHSKGQGWAWVCEVNVASTWNQALCNKQGKVIGEESMWFSDSRGQVNGWYGPAMNTHRNPLAGRNFEYYSQDGVQGGLIAAAVVGGYVEKGGHVYIKHSFMNDQETGRTGGVTFATEQSMREIYAKVFEYAIRKGNANGIMFAFNLIGLASSSSYATNVQLYTNEWGYDGLSVTDMWSAPATGWYGWQMIRGLTMPLGNNTGANKIQGTWDPTLRNGKGGLLMNKTIKDVGKDDTESATQWYWTRELAKRAMFVVGNGNGMKNGVTFDSKMFDTTNIGIELDKAFTSEPVVDVEKAKAALGEGNYLIEAQGLPTGLTIDPATGVISGTVASTGTNAVKKGSYTATISVSSKTEGEQWVRTSANIVFAVGPIFTFKGSFDGAKAGKAISSIGLLKTDMAGLGIISSGANANYVPDGKATEENIDKYIGAPTYSATGLPYGLKINATTGEITGTPTVGGDYVITYTMTLKKVTQGSRGISTSNVNFQQVVKMSVSDTALVGMYNNDKNQLTLIYEDADGRFEVVLGSIKGDKGDTGATGATGEAGVGIQGIEKTGENGLNITYTITLTNGNKFEFTVANGAAGAVGGTGATGANGVDGKDAGAGAGVAGAVMGGIALAGMIALGVMFFLNKKKA